MVLEIDFKSGKPVHLQIVGQVQAAAVAGALRPGEALPAIGPLALELRINRNAIAKAYSELERLGVIESLPGTGYLLKETSSPLRNDARRRLLLAADTGPGLRSTPLTRQTLMAFLKTIAPEATYLGSLAAAGFILLRSGAIESTAMAVLAMVVLAAVLMPLPGLIQRLADRARSDSSHERSSRLQGIEAAVGSAPDLESFVEIAIEQTRTIMDAGLEWMHDYPSMLSLVNTVPSLRSARSPVRTGSGLAMPIVSGDELAGILRFTRESANREYDEEDSRFLSGVAEHATLVSDRFRQKREKQEGEYALDIQLGLLPRDIPQFPGFSIAGAWQPARVVGGDYYDVLRLSESRVALVVGDVSGKGIPAALLMANLQATVKAYATAETAPSVVCAKVNNAVCSSVTTGRFITFFYVVIDTAERRMEYVNAGHNPALVARRDGSCIRLETGGPILGVFPNAPYDQAALDLLPGDRLVIFTDGITEAHGEGFVEFGEESVVAILRDHPQGPASDLRDAIMRSVAEFCHEDFADDATLLTVIVDSEE